MYHIYIYILHRGYVIHPRFFRLIKTKYSRMNFYKPPIESKVGFVSLKHNPQMKNGTMIGILNSNTREVEAITGIDFVATTDKEFDREVRMFEAIEQARLYMNSHKMYQILKMLVQMNVIDNYKYYRMTIEVLKSIDENYSDFDDVLGVGATSTFRQILKQRKK